MFKKSLFVLISISSLFIACSEQSTVGHDVSPISGEWERTNRIEEEGLEFHISLDFDEMGIVRSVNTLTRKDYTQLDTPLIIFSAEGTYSTTLDSLKIIYSKCKEPNENGNLVSVNCPKEEPLAWFEIIEPNLRIIANECYSGECLDNEYIFTRK